jgi:hypothetical protein
MSSRLWRWYADRQFHKWEKTVLWDMVEPYRPPRSFAPLVGTYVAAFYTAVVAAALTEQLYKVSRAGSIPRLLPPPPPHRTVSCPRQRSSARRAEGARPNAQRGQCHGHTEQPKFFCIHLKLHLIVNFCYILEQEKYWEDHPGEAVPIMQPKFYWGPWRVVNGEVPRFIQPPDEAAKTA